ncbi:MAG: hypothetical protein AAFQ44_11745, partial [Pseudomonadota bacterium]
VEQPTEKKRVRAMVLKAGLITAVVVVSSVSAWAPASAHERSYRHSHNSDGTVVRAPRTRVEVERDGSTRVRAPETRVEVDRRRRTIRIRVPYFSGDIRY